MLIQFYPLEVDFVFPIVKFTEYRSTGVSLISAKNSAILGLPDKSVYIGTSVGILFIYLPGECFVGRAL